MPIRRFMSFVKTVVVTTTFLSFNLHAKAQVATPVVAANIDTNGSRYLKETPGFIVNLVPASNASLKDAGLQQALQLSIRKPAGRKLLMEHLRSMSNATQPEANHANKKFLYNLAGAFARLKMYSLAMKCFFKSMKYNNSERVHPVDTIVVTPPDSLKADAAKPDERYLNFNDKDDTSLNNDTVLLAPNIRETRSPKITYEHIAETFKDGKKAVAYAMLIHVKQPVSGKAKVYHFTNSGHTFITLIKYNSDSTYVSLSFGFYPDKQHPFAGSPLFPTANPLFRNDSEHKWDEVAGKFISKRRFEKILSLTKNYNGLKYHLSKNNCTDFSLNAALLADLTINETTGSWPLGNGNNPGITGQSMLQGKMKDGRKADLEEVFVDNTVKQ